MVIWKLVNPLKSDAFWSFLNSFDIAFLNPLSCVLLCDHHRTWMDGLCCFLCPPSVCCFRSSSNLALLYKMISLKLSTSFSVLWLFLNYSWPSLISRYWALLNMRSSLKNSAPVYGHFGSYVNSISCFVLVFEVWTLSEVVRLLWSSLMVLHSEVVELRNQLRSKFCDHHRGYWTLRVYSLNCDQCCCDDRYCIHDVSWSFLKLLNSV